MKIEEVLDTAVAVSENDERLELLGDDRLGRIREDLGRLEIEQRGVRAGPGRRPNRVTQPHVDLEPQTRRAAMGRHDDTGARMLVFRPNRLDPESSEIELHRVRLHLHATNHLDVRPNGTE